MILTEKCDKNKRGKSCPERWACFWARKARRMAKKAGLRMSVRLLSETYSLLDQSSVHQFCLNAVDPEHAAVVDICDDEVIFTIFISEVDRQAGIIEPDG